MYRHLLTLTGIVCIATGIVSCDSFNTKVPASEIKKASAWSKSDQYPSYPDCEGLSGSKAKKCFGSILGDSISEYLANQELRASKEVDSEIILLLKVTKEGVIELSSIDDPNNILSSIADLETILADAVAELPQAQAAVKTNADTKVQVSLKLPIQIIATASE